MPFWLVLYGDKFCTPHTIFLYSNHHKRLADIYAIVYSTCYPQLLIHTVIQISTITMTTIVVSFFHYDHGSYRDYNSTPQTVRENRFLMELEEDRQHAEDLKIRLCSAEERRLLLILQFNYYEWCRKLMLCIVIQKMLCS
jgi:hypothetical protein